MNNNTKKRRNNANEALRLALLRLRMPTPPRTTVTSQQQRNNANEALRLALLRLRMPTPPRTTIPPARTTSGGSRRPPTSSSAATPRWAKKNLSLNERLQAMRQAILEQRRQRLLNRQNREARLLALYMPTAPSTRVYRR